MQRIRQLPLLLLGFLILFASTAHAQDNNGITLTVQAGFDRYHKNQHWFPVQIEVANTGPSIEGEVRFVSGDPTFEQQVVYTAPLSLPTQSNKRVTLIVNPANATAEQTVELRDENGRLLHSELVSSLINLDTSELLYGVVSPDAGELANLESGSIGAFSGAFVALLGLDDLPETAVAWQNFDVLILNDVDSSQLTSDQQDALRSWIELGGQLVVTGGNGWEKTATAVADLLPVTILGSETVEDLPNFNQQLLDPVPFRDPGPYLVTTSTLTNGELIFHEDGLPILASHSVGRGAVYFLALDPRSAPLIDWDGAEQLWEAIVDRVPPKQEWQYPILNGPSAVSSASALPELNLPAVWQLLLFLLLYVILIGPINYFVLKRRQQLDRAWLTIPVIVILFSIGTYIVGTQIRGNESIINQVSVSVSSANSEQREVQTLIGLYAPQRGSYDLILPPNTGIRPLTSGGFGGLGSATDVRPISQSGDVRVANMRLDVGEVTTFATQSIRPALSVVGEGTLSSDESGETTLTVNVLNNSDETLQTAVLLLGNAAIDLGEIQPGESKQIDRSFTQFSLSSITGSGAFPGNRSILMQKSDQLLGTSSYYSDPVLYPRWEFLQAITNFERSSQQTAVPLTLAFWTNEVGIDTTLSRSAKTSSVMLHLIELPLTSNLTIGDNSVIPYSLLSWNIMESTNVYAPQPTDIAFSGNGSVAFEYTPLADFRYRDISALTVKVGSAGSPETMPIVALWDWQANVWTELEDVVWGETAVDDFTPFIGLDNTVRIRIVDQSDFGIYIDSVYPIMVVGEQN